MEIYQTGNTHQISLRKHSDTQILSAGKLGHSELEDRALGALIVTSVCYPISVAAVSTIKHRTCFKQFCLFFV